MWKNQPTVLNNCFMCGFRVLEVMRSYHLCCCTAGQEIVSPFWGWAGLCHRVGSYGWARPMSLWWRQADQDCSFGAEESKLERLQTSQPHAAAVMKVLQHGCCRLPVTKHKDAFICISCKDQQLTENFNVMFGISVIFCNKENTICGFLKWGKNVF